MILNISGRMQKDGGLCMTSVSTPCMIVGLGRIKLSLLLLHKKCRQMNSMQRLKQTFDLWMLWWTFRRRRNPPRMTSLGITTVINTVLMLLVLCGSREGHSSVVEG